MQVQCTRATTLYIFHLRKKEEGSFVGLRFSVRHSVEVQLLRVLEGPEGATRESSL